MGALQRFEQRLEQVISGVFAKAFRSAVQPVEISAALQRELDNNAQILSRERRLVPNDFHVELSESDLARLQDYDNALTSDLARQLEEHAETQGYVFPGPVSIALEPAEDLSTGRFRVRSKAQASVTGAEHRTRHRSPQAVLEINGTRHPLLPPGMVVGRGSESDIRISDPGISRRHVEFSIVAGRGGTEVLVRDLGSTNGTFVEGRRTDQARVGDGAQVRVGTTVVTIHLTGAGGAGGAGRRGRSDGGGA